MKKITIVHTSLVSHAHLNQLFAEIIPEAKIHNIVDDSLLAEVSENGGITPNIVNRMCKYFQSAEAIGSDLIFSQCSSVGEAAKIAAKTVSVPLLRIDEAMNEEAVQLGKKIAVVATVASTVKPSCDVVREKAEAEYKANRKKQQEVVTTAVVTDAETGKETVVNEVRGATVAKEIIAKCIDNYVEKFCK